MAQKLRNILCREVLLQIDNIDYSLVSERWYFFLQLQIGPTDLFMVVP
jgi:hypothetical protein